MTFPADYHAKDLAGQTVSVRYHRQGGRSEPILPEIDADFAKALGVADGDVGQDARRNRRPTSSAK
jgi:trigger factor